MGKPWLTKSRDPEIREEQEQVLMFKGDVGKEKVRMLGGYQGDLEAERKEFWVADTEASKEGVRGTKGRVWLTGRFAVRKVRSSVWLTWRQASKRSGSPVWLTGRFGSRKVRSPVWLTWRQINTVRAQEVEFCCQGDLEAGR
jgi:hypothetical protein